MGAEIPCVLLFTSVTCISQNSRSLPTARPSVCSHPPIEDMGWAQSVLVTTYPSGCHHPVAALSHFLETPSRKHLVQGFR